MKKLKTSSIAEILNITNNNLLLLNQYIAAQPAHEYTGEILENTTNYQLLLYQSLQQSDDHICLFIPSFINKPYIFDLHDNSFLKKLADKGLKSVLLAWKEEAYKKLNFDDYLKIIDDIIASLAKRYKKISLAGYCLGGILALKAAENTSYKLESLHFIATPIDFSKLPYNIPNISNTQLFWLEKMQLYTPYIPSTFFQTLFFTISFAQLSKKYFYLDSSKINDDFIAVERWINDANFLNTVCYIHVLKDFFIGNQLMNQTTITKELKIYGYVAQNDLICSSNSTIALKNIFPPAVIKIFNTGHIGLLLSKSHNIADELVHNVKNLRK